MIKFIQVAQIITGITLSILVLVQVKGTGFGRVWGNVNSFSRRGLEGFVFKLTFVIAFLFLVASITTLFI